MNSALRLVLGVSVLSFAVGCDNAGGDTEPGTHPMAVGTSGTGTSGGSAANSTSGSGNSTAGAIAIPMGGTDSTGGTGTAGSGPSPGTGGTSLGGTGTGTGGTAVEATGVPLTATDGWVDAASNTLGVQGAMFSYADETSMKTLTPDFAGTDACIKGTAAKVDLKCTPVAPAVDCYGQFWGAAIGLNLNQPTVMMDGVAVGGSPMPFDASALKGFAFDISGAAVPVSLRFKIENANGEYCSPPATPVKLGANSFLFSQLLTQCWKAGGMSAEGAKSALVKIAWQVVTNDKSAVPFDYCVANVRALQ